MDGKLVIIHDSEIAHLRNTFAAEERPWTGYPTLEDDSNREHNSPAQYESPRDDNGPSVVSGTRESPKEGGHCNLRNSDGHDVENRYNPYFFLDVFQSGWCQKGYGFSGTRFHCKRDSYDTAYSKYLSKATLALGAEGRCHLVFISMNVQVLGQWVFIMYPRYTHK